MAYSGTRKGRRHAVAEVRRAWLTDSDLLELAGNEVLATDGRCFAYVFPCQWEDHCKIGFSGDPLGRISALHPRWFEFFALERGVLVEAESVRDARDLELALREGFGEYNAPAPLAIRVPAGGHTEWFRGVEAELGARVAALARGGYRVHSLRDWLRVALEARCDRLYEWTLSQLSADELEDRQDSTPAQRRVRDVLDACVALDIELALLLAPVVLGWYRREASGE
ncbi:GIY-YIG nuclease family protein [Pseudoxanthomonas suwonensis]|uniref:GIY-YIG nuclease family protein n=1 Tax=Pseudoxanthomonas suwonensis TaxID=314722 RepID=UPI0004ACDD2C